LSFFSTPQAFSLSHNVSCVQTFTVHSLYTIYEQLPVFRSRELVRYNGV